MSSESTPVGRAIHPSPDHGILECPDCDTSIVGSYQDLILHYLDEHAVADRSDETGEGTGTLARIKRAQQQAQLDD